MKWCPNCGALVTGNSLMPAFPGQLFGDGFLTFVMFKRVGLKLALATIVEDLGMFLSPRTSAAPRASVTGCGASPQT